MNDTWRFCPFCGTSAEQKKTHRTRSNGTGNVYKRGKTYTARVTIGYKLDGNRLVQVFRTKGGFPTKTEALNYLPELRKSPGEANQKITLLELYNEWFAAHENTVTHSTMLCYQSAWKYFSDLYYTQFTEISPHQLQLCIDNCPKGKRTRQNMKALASLLYKHAKHYEIIDVNKADTLKFGKGETKKYPAFSMEELEKIKQSKSEYASYIVALCYLGCRPNELFIIPKSRLDLDRLCIVTGSKTAAGKDRLITFSPKILPIMKKQLQTPGEFLFPRLPKGEKMTPNCFARIFKKEMSALQISGRVPYSCRHTYSNLLKNIKGSGTDKAALMGHSEYSMTQYYQEADYQSLRAITDLM